MKNREMNECPRCYNKESHLFGYCPSYWCRSCKKTECHHPIKKCKICFVGIPYKYNYCAMHTCCIDKCTRGILNKYHCDIHACKSLSVTKCYRSINCKNHIIYNHILEYIMIMPRDIRNILLFYFTTQN